MFMDYTYRVRARTAQPVKESLAGVGAVHVLVESRIEAGRGILRCSCMIQPIAGYARDMRVYNA